MLNYFKIIIRIIFINILLINKTYNLLLLIMKIGYTSYFIIIFLNINLMTLKKFIWLILYFFFFVYSLNENKLKSIIIYLNIQRMNKY